MEINTFSLIYVYMYICVHIYIYIYKAGFSVNTKFYKTTIDLCWFSPPVFFFFFFFLKVALKRIKSARTPL